MRTRYSLIVTCALAHCRLTPTLPALAPVIAIVTLSCMHAMRYAEQAGSCMLVTTIRSNRISRQLHRFLSRAVRPQALLRRIVPACRSIGTVQPH